VPVLHFSELILAQKKAVRSNGICSVQFPNPLARRPPVMHLTSSFDSLLLTFAPVFTDPSFVTFRLLMTGWILSVRHRYVTDLIISSDSVGNGHYSDYHR